MLNELPQCVRDLVEWVAGGRATLVCPVTRVKGEAQMGGGAKKRGKKADAQPEGGDGWRAFFYHLGQVYTDYELLRHGAQDVVLQLLLVVSADPMGTDDIEVYQEWITGLGLHAPTLLELLLGKGFVQSVHKGAAISEGGLVARTARHGTGFLAEREVVKRLAPLLQHLLRLSYLTTDFIAGVAAISKMEKALGIAERMIWKVKGVSTPVKPAESLPLAAGIVELMSAPCRGVKEGVQGLSPAAFVANQHRLSRSGVYHKVFRDLPQYMECDEDDGSCVGGESTYKCREDRERNMSQEEKVGRVCDNH
jgi:hypothetical protein